MRVLLFDRFFPQSTTLRKQRMGYWQKGIPTRGDSFLLDSQRTNDEFFDVGITWGPRRGDEAKRLAFHHLVMECGFLGERLRNFSLSISDLNGRGRPATRTFVGRGELWYPELKSCRTRGHKRVAILAQVPRDASLLPLSPDFDSLESRYLQWLNGVVSLCKAKGFEVGIRKHPSVSPRWWELHCPRGVIDLDYNKWPKEQLWEWADVATAFSSNALVEAFIAGVDVVPAHPTSLVWDVRSYFCNPRSFTLEEKIQWLDFVASHQWSIDEIESGEAWERAKENL